MKDATAADAYVAVHHPLPPALIAGLLAIPADAVIAVDDEQRIIFFNAGLITLPLAMTGVAVALTLLGSSLVAVGVLLAAWVLLGTAAPVAWWAWLSRVLPDDAEAGGGLMVAVIQLAIALGSTLGGSLFDAAGYRGAYFASAVALLASGLIAAAGRSRSA